MIDSLQGTLIDIDEDRAVVDVNGIRFQTEISLNTYNVHKDSVGSPCIIYTRLSFNANDGQFSLFGFENAVERECFDIFTGISGIGPRKGLMILSQVEIASFANAIVQNDLTYLSKIKGVGKKTAERLVVELREKMVPYTSEKKPAAQLPPREGPAAEAIQALIVLGCKEPVAEKAVGLAQEELGESASTQELIRLGLKYR